MGTRYIGPGQTYATIADANALRSGSDTFVCRFNTEDSSFIYSTFPTEVVADDGFTPAWIRSGALCTAEAGLVIEGLRVGRSDVGTSYLFAATAQTVAGLSIEMRDCTFDLVGGSHALANMGAIAVGSSPLTLRMLRCTMAPGSNRFGTLQGVAGLDAAKVGRGHLLVEDCPLIDTNSLRVVAANGLFDEQSIKRSILRIYSASGAVGDFAAGAVCRIWQSLLDGMGSAGALVTANLAAMTLDIKSADIGHSASTAIVITNPAGQPIRNSAIHHNSFAGINASANVTDNCLFGNNGADYVGGGAVGASDVLGIPTNTDRANADYTPDADSDTIDVGTDEGFLTDIRGEAIPQGAGPDIGPYEYPAAPPPPPPPLAVEIDGAIRHMTTMDGGSIVSGIQAEIIPTVGEGPLNCIRRMLLIWAGTDKRCLPEELPHGQEDDRRRGWLGDSDLGNRLWLYSRAPLSTAIDDEIRAKTIEDLTWLTDGGFAAAYDVTVTHSGRRRDISVSVTAPDGSTAAWAIDDLWTVRS